MCILNMSRLFSCIGSSFDLEPPPAAPALEAAQNAQMEALDYKASAPAAPAGLPMDLPNSGSRITGDRKRAAQDDDDVEDPKIPKLQSSHNRDGVDETISPFSRTRTVPRFFIPCVCTLAACVRACVCWVCACVMQDRERHRERARASERESET
jgi:hypothetical protein